MVLWPSWSSSSWVNRLLRALSGWQSVRQSEEEFFKEHLLPVEKLEVHSLAPGQQLMRASSSSSCPEKTDDRRSIPGPTRRCQFLALSPNVNRSAWSLWDLRWKKLLAFTLFLWEGGGKKKKKVMTWNDGRFYYIIFLSYTKKTPTDFSLTDFAWRKTFYLLKLLLLCLSFLCTLI